MKALLRDGIERMPAPLPVLLQDAYRHLRYPRVRRRRQDHRRIMGRLETSDRVAQGPFRGMRYLATAFCSEVLPKIVGTYEREIAPAIEAICRSGRDRIVDIGAAEGYYAVGMALRNPGTRVLAFEMNPSARYYLRQLARQNAVVGRVETLGTCDLESLGQALEGATRPAVIADCEGAEDALLQPDQVEALRRSMILVETHDGLATDAGVLAGITDRLLERFGPSHAIEVIPSVARKPGDLPEGNQLSRDEGAEAMDEGRPWAQWLFMTPKDESPGPVATPP